MNRRAVLLLIGVLAACRAPTEPATAAVQAVATQVRITSSALPSVWAITIDDTNHVTQGVGPIYPFGYGLGDTLRIEVPADTMSHLVYGLRLHSNGWPMCHDWRWVRPGEVVTLSCGGDR